MITILRLGHRVPRDKRTTSHVALVARAFGADRMLVSVRDESLERSVRQVVRRFGGSFELETGCRWRDVLASWQGRIVHLTMYGEPLDDVIARIPRDEDLLVVVGAEKMPSEVFRRAHFNVSVGNQPHSEVSALALFLDRYFEGEELDREFDGELKVVPSKSGKKVVSKDAARSVQPEFSSFPRGVPSRNPKGLPTREYCLKVLRDEGCDDATIRHSKAVNRLAVKMARLCGADIALVNVASLVHDIGRSKGHNMRHGVEGAAILRELGFPEEVVRIAERHIGAGLDREDAKELGLPPEDYLPETLEEKIVCHADNLIVRERRVRLETVIKQYEKQGLTRAIERMKKLHRELSALCGLDLDEIEL